MEKENSQINNQTNVVRSYSSNDDKSTFNKPKNNLVQKDFSEITKNIEAKIEVYSKKTGIKLKKFVSIQKMMEAGIHYGLPSHLWNPKMKIFIRHSKLQKKLTIDVFKIIVFLNRACNYLSDIVKQGGKILFVATHNDFIKKHIANEAKRVKEYFINQRWLGGTLTNYKTVVNSINNLNKLLALVETNEISKYPKNEQVSITKQIAKLMKFLGGIKDMNGLPQVIVTIDSVLENNAIKEAHQLKIPIVSFANTNANPDLIDFVIPGNTNSSRSLWLLLSILVDTIAEAKGLEKKVVDKKDSEIILPEIVKQPRKIVNFRQQKKSF